MDLVEKISKDIITLEDGYRYYDTGKGAMSAKILRQIADILDDENKEWDDIVKSDMDISNKP